MFWLNTQKAGVCSTHRRRNSSVNIQAEVHIMQTPRICANFLPILLSAYALLPHITFIACVNKIDSHSWGHDSSRNKGGTFQAENQGVWCLHIQFGHITWYESPKPGGETRILWKETNLSWGTPLCFHSGSNYTWRINDCISYLSLTCVIGFLQQQV